MFEGCSDGIQTGCHRIHCISLETTILLMYLKVVVLTEAAVVMITDADYWRWLKETSFLRIVNHYPSVSGRSGIRQMWMCLLHAVGSAKSFLVSPFASLLVRPFALSFSPCQKSFGLGGAMLIRGRFGRGERTGKWKRRDGNLGQFTMLEENKGWKIENVDI